MSNSCSQAADIREGFGGTTKEECGAGISVPMERSR